MALQMLLLVKVGGVELVVMGRLRLSRPLPARCRRRLRRRRRGRLRKPLQLPILRRQLLMVLLRLLRMLRQWLLWLLRSAGGVRCCRNGLRPCCSHPSGSITAAATAAAASCHLLHKAHRLW